MEEENMNSEKNSYKKKNECWEKEQEMKVNTCREEEKRDSDVHMTVKPSSYVRLWFVLFGLYEIRYK